MNITRFAITNNRTSLMLLLSALLFGAMAFINMPKDYDPGYIIRTAQVITYFPGASPERVELLVSNPLEKVIQEIPELDYVTSESRTGVSIVKVNILDSYTEMRPIWDNLRRKIDGARDDLPEDAHAPIVNDEFGDVFGIVVGLTAEGFSYRELEEIAEQVKDEFLRLPETAKVEILGAQEERIFIEYDHARLAELGLSPSQLREQLAGRNIIIPGGSINLGPEKITLQPTGNFESVAEIGSTVISVPNSSQVLFLSDIASVYRGYADPAETVVRSNGERALALAISMREGGNNIRLGEQVRDKLGYLETVYPIGVEFSLVAFLPDEVLNKVSDFTMNLLQSIAVVSLVMLLTLGIRTGMIVALLIPASIVSAILFMSLLDIGLDQISLAALIISLGMLVDNGIVVSENIMVEMSQGKSPVEASIHSANQLKTPLMVSSLTTAAAFLPIFLAESSTGEYTASLFKVVTITLLCSWLISMSIIPMLCVYFMKVSERKQDLSGAFYRAYRGLLTTLLRYRWMSLMATALIFLLAMQGFNHVPKLFFGLSDRPYFKVELELPVGTRIETMDAVTRQIEAFIQSELQVGEGRDQGVTDWVSYVGFGGARFLLTHTPKPRTSNYALLVVKVTSVEEIDRVMAELDAHAFSHYPDLLLKLRKIENGKAVENPVEIRLSGPDSGELMMRVEQVKQLMTRVGGLKAISDDWGMPIKKLMINIDQTAARRAGVSNRDIASSLQTGLSGVELTQYREDEDVIPVVMRSLAADRRDIGKLEALTVYAQSGLISVPLRQVAEIEVVWQPARILRRDREKTVTIGAQVSEDMTASQAFRELEPLLQQAQQGWPFGYRYEFGGEAESSEQANQSIVEKLPLAGFIIVFLLVSQFNSFRKSVVVLATIPLGLIGVVVGLLLARSYFGFMTLLGVVSLSGIVINNAIVLLERIQFEIDETGLPPAQAIIEAGQRRMRPILLTTATTVFGLIPLYLGGGEMWEPLAVAIIGGLLLSTLFTLCVIPVIYALLFGVTMTAVAESR